MSFTCSRACHHIVVDGSGIALVGHRIASVYSAVVSGEPVPPAFFGSLQDLVDCESNTKRPTSISKIRPIGLGIFQRKADRIIGCPKPRASAIRIGLLRRFNWTLRSFAEFEELSDAVERAAIIGHHRGVRTFGARVVRRGLRGGARLPGQQASTSGVEDASRDGCRGRAAGVEDFAGLYGCRFL